MTATRTEEASLESLVARVVDEFRERHRRGEQPSPEEYAARHPHASGVLREVLAALRVVGLSAAGLAPAEERAVTGTLGDFRILREVGRGGMGVVYEAEQVSLGRRVALKVLPFAAAMDARLLQRFRNEAHAAAQLHHSNIVPVHAVGCEWGVPYFAMQFIDGHTLAALVRQQRQRAGLEAADEATSSVGTAAPAAETDCRPAAATERSIRDPAYFRTVARLGVQAAEALEHAHQLGITHRDVKPANLLVDAGGRLWVTDFGLAQCQSQLGLTLTGDLVGTLRYMSPEQALGRRVDNRTDIYSLGATLYELLTLEPVHGGHERQELLRQIAGDVPRPARRLNPSVPSDLETVVLKALEKEPETRYATAAELADDLRRFLEDKPIRARRPTLAQRARKWARRHRSVVVAAVLVLATAVLGLAVGSVLLATAWRSEATQRRQAEAKERLARQAVDDLYTLMTREWWAGLPKEQSVREFLREALHFYHEFARDESPEPAARRQRGEAYLRVGQIQSHLLAPQPAEEAFLLASALFEQLVAEFPDVPEYRESLAASYHDRAGLLRSTSRFHEAEASLNDALPLMEKVVAEAPTPLRRHRLALYRLSLAALLHTQGRLEGAEQAARRASEEFAGLREEFPAASDHALGLARSRHRLGMVLQDEQKVERAEAAFRQALLPLGELEDRFLTNPVAALESATIRASLGNLLQSTGRTAEAERAYVEARSVFEKLAAGSPATPSYRNNLALCNDRLGFLHVMAGQYQEAGEALGRARPIFEKLVRDVPDVAWNQARWADLLQHEAALAYYQGDFEKATTLVEQALPHYQSALKVLPQALEFREGCRTTSWLRAHVLILQGKHAAAARAAGGLSRLGVSAWKDPADAAGFLAECVSLAENDPTLPAPKRQEVAQAYRGQARQLLREALRAGDQNCAAQESLSWLLAMGADPQLRDPERAVALAQRAVEQGPNQASPWLKLGVARYRAGDYRGARTALEKSAALGYGSMPSLCIVLAMAHWQLGEREEARRCYDRAVAGVKGPVQTQLFLRLRSEAAALIGLPAPAAMPPKTDSREKSAGAAFAPGS